MVTIKVRQNGSLLVEGEDVKLVDWNGNEYVLNKKPFALCRCGQSQRKPFCDCRTSSATSRRTKRRQGRMQSPPEPAAGVVQTYMVLRRFCRVEAFAARPGGEIAGRQLN